MNTNFSDRKTAYLLFLSVGILILLAGFGFLFGQGVTPVRAQDEAPDSSRNPRDYEGSRECFSCHRGNLRDVHETSPHALTLREADEEGVILADFAGDVPEFQFPGEDAARALTADDIQYAVGAGRRIQRYVYDAGDEQYMVLPFEWNVEEQTWQPYTPGHPSPNAGYDWNAGCAGCHTTGFDAENGEWSEEGVQCEACHGPGREHIELADEAGRRASEDEIQEIRDAVYSGPDSQMCGQCHAAGVDSSGLPYPASYLPGTNLLDSFTLAAPDDSAHWWPTGHASQMNMQFNEWLGNTHANSLNNLKDSGEPVEDLCLSCHSVDAAFQQRRLALYEAGELSDPAPQAAAADSAQFGVTCVACHAPHKADENGERVAYQTGSADTYTLCTQCHSNANLDFIHYPAQEMFEGRAIIPNVEAVPSSHFTEETGPRCATCHMTAVLTSDAVSVSSHSLQPVLPGPALNVEGLEDSCITCHRRQVNGAQMQALIDDVQADTRARLDAAAAGVQDTTPDWVSTALAFVEGDGSLGIHNYAYTDALLDAVEAELGFDQPDTGNAPSTGS